MGWANHYIEQLKNNKTVQFRPREMPPHRTGSNVKASPPTQLFADYSSASCVSRSNNDVVLPWLSRLATLYNRLPRI